MENCIVRAQAGQSFASYSSVAAQFYNCLFHGGSVDLYGTAAVLVANCTFYNDNGGADTPALWISYDANAVIKNCISYTAGASHDDIKLSFSATFGAGSGNCAVSDTSGPASGAVTGLTMSDIFESLSSGSEDFRVKDSAPSSVRTGGMDTTTWTNDLDIVGRTRHATTPTIGAWEAAGGSSGIANPLSGKFGAFMRGKLG
jgi:hypothetical protein